MQNLMRRIRHLTKEKGFVTTALLIVAGAMAYANFVDFSKAFGLSVDGACIATAIIVYVSSCA